MVGEITLFLTILGLFLLTSGFFGYFLIKALVGSAIAKWFVTSASFFCAWVYTLMLRSCILDAAKWLLVHCTHFISLPH
jgi:hypothetical protein